MSDFVPYEHSVESAGKVHKPANFLDTASNCQRIRNLVRTLTNLPSTVVNEDKVNVGRIVERRCKLVIHK